MTDSDLPNSATRGFTSYTRADNDAFRNVVDQLRDDLQAMYAATTGKEIKLFLDRESIGWGEDWRQRIHESVEEASVFIPLITMRYFTSQMCMEELQTFYAAAERLGVTELILPIVLFGADQIRDDDARPEVRLISTLNYKNAMEAWVAGYDSPAWRAFILDCVTDLDRAIQRAESSITVEENGASTGVGGPTDNADASQGEGGLAVGIDDMTERMERVEPLTQTALQELNVIAEVISELEFEGVPVKVARARTIAAANRLREPAQRIRDTGQELEDLLFTLDSEVRALVAEVSTIDLQEARDGLSEMLQAFESETDWSDIESEIQGAIDVIRMLSLANVTLRTALEPAASGFRSIKKAVGIFKGWTLLAEELRSERGHSVPQG